jgi:hypothetical protein
MPSVLIPIEGEQEQTPNETLVWTLDVSGFTSSPASPVLSKVTDTLDNTDVKSTVMPSGSISVSAAIITLPPLTALTADKHYRIYIQFTDGGANTFEAYVEIFCPPF